MTVEDWKNGGFGLYVHWPFCEAKCPYCDFNSHVVQRIDQTRWARALAQEVRRVAAQTPGRVLNSIFFGGGTPSLMEPETVHHVLDASRDSWLWANDIEITLEANPRSVEAGKFEGFAEAGVNRISMGIQSLRQDDLRRLGRLHNVDEAREAFGIARSVFDRVSFDLIYARQGQSLKDWENELREALDMSVDHLSLYQLTIEKGTAFWDRAQVGKLRDLPDEDLSADMYELTQQICESAGFPAYEVSNHARVGAESRHNLIYWRYGDYAGVGPGAHGRMTIAGTKFATVSESMPALWLKGAEQGNGEISRDVLDRSEQLSEYLMMGLRLNEGVSLDRIHNNLGGSLDQESLRNLVDLGLVWTAAEALGVTQKGRLVLNAVIAELMP